MERCVILLRHIVSAPRCQVITPRGTRDNEAENCREPGISLSSHLTNLRSELRAVTISTGLYRTESAQPGW